MKINKPITDNEKSYGADTNILSTTDLKGAITYANPSFVEISGFSTEELLGTNHNIMRHPDMPPAAFQNLWDDIQAGKPWMGIVKNRCKNGDYYWVDAFVVPIMENGVTVEYQSVRYKPNPEWVERAESIYKRISDGKSVNPSLRSRIGLGKQLLLGNLLALAPALLTSTIESFSAFTPVGFLVTAALIALVNILLMKPFGALVIQAKSLFDNDLMSKIYTDRDDDFGRIELALKIQNSQLRSVIGRISDTTRIMGDMAKTTADASYQANQGVTAQQNEITQVATAMTEMASTVHEVAKNAATAAESTVIGLNEASSGKQVVTTAIDAINRLADEIQQAAGVINKLSEYSANIGDILGVIKGIAEQTNLLALNAAIEAARAGEQGRGFAVVADEVRTLAGRTQESTQQIETMIEQLQGGSQDAVQVMEKSREMAKESVEHAASAGEALETITNAINSISDMNRQIATASEEQSAVAEEINKNIVNISEVAEATSQGAASSVNATKEIVETISHLDNLVVQFRR
jgi:aerotaxis receptor